MFTDYDGIQLWRETPLIESHALSRAAGCRIFLKLETLQPSGSFKSRGMGNYILSCLRNHPDPANIHLFCASAGNAGLGCVTASRTLAVPATIVVPHSTKPRMITKLKAAGAYDVIQYGECLADADKYMREIVMARNKNAVYVSPFDHEEIWAGNATLVPELYAQLGGEKPDAVVCGVGGGGLLNGVVQGLDAVGWSDVTVLGVETKGADSLHASLSAKKLVTLPCITSQASSLGVSRISEKTFEYAQRQNVKNTVLTDEEAALGCSNLAEDERIMVELACGVSVALCYNGKLERSLGRPITKDSKVVIVLCGGSNVTVDMVADWKRGFYGPVIEPSRGPPGIGAML